MYRNKVFGRKCSIQSKNIIIRELQRQISKENLNTKKIPTTNNNKNLFSNKKTHVLMFLSFFFVITFIIFISLAGISNGYKNCQFQHKHSIARYYLKLTKAQ